LISKKLFIFGSRKSKILKIMLLMLILGGFFGGDSGHVWMELTLHSREQCQTYCTQGTRLTYCPQNTTKQKTTRCAVD